MDSRIQMNMHSDVTYISRSSSNSFVSQQALRVGMIERIYYVSDSPNVGIEFQHELEKKKIQEQLFAAEIAHKQELEVKVRREILMDRKLELQRREGFQLMAPSSSSLMHYPCNARVNKSLSSFDSAEYGAFSRMPFQSHPGALLPEVKSIPQVRTGQLLVLPKPLNPNLSKTERKAEVPASAGACELPVVGVNKKTQKWSCKLCQVSTTCEQGLKDHFQGKKHKKKASQLKARKSSKQGQKLKGKKRGMKKGKKKLISHVRVEKNNALN